MAAPTTASHETAPAAPMSTATAGPHPRSGRHLHSRGKKGDDPFLTRSLTAEVGEQFRQPSPGQADTATPHDGDNTLLADLIVTPLTMISFIFSLTLIDRRQRRWRLSQHRSPDTTAGWSRAWLDPNPEPYQASPNPRRENERGANAEKGSADSYSGWYTRKKKRAIARMEISDAFEMRKRVVFALLVWSGLVIWAACYLLRTLYSWTMGT